METGGTVAGQDGSEITDTSYDTDGWVAFTDGPYFANGAPRPTYVQAAPTQEPSQTSYTYDGDGRKTAMIASTHATDTWQTTYSYGGNFVTTVPPQGGTATTTVTNALGQTTDQYQYHAGVPADPVHDPASDYSDTRYTYTPQNKQATVIDPAGNTWSYQYDLLGDQTQFQDPDAGTTTDTYDPAGQLITTTDSRGQADQLHLRRRRPQDLRLRHHRRRRGDRE
jgi:YD repeat-containing protein